MSLYYKKKLISGVRDVPSMTLAQYNALTNKPKLWIRTDAPSGDRGINADDIQYDNDISVKEKIDDLSPLNDNINFSFAVNNAQNITFTLDDTPSSSYNGSLILFNANRGTMALITIGQTQTITVIFGNVTYTISSSGKSVTVVPSERMWGKTVILGHVSV